MNLMKHLLVVTLVLAAIGQFSIAMINLTLVRIMHWQDDVSRIPLLIRQVFHVHAWFISLTLVIFAALTCRFAVEMTAGTEQIYRWIACSIGLFWTFRVALQLWYYKSSHWRGIRSRTTVHIILLIVYSGFSIVYLTAGLRG